MGLDLPLADIARDPVVFRRNLKIDNDGAPTFFGECLDDWQEEDFRAMDGGLRRLVGVGGGEDAKRRFYFERSRGHSKTTDIAVAVSWPMAFAPRKIQGVVCASDSDQALLLVEAIEILLQLNPWLQNLLKIKTGKVVNVKTGSELEIIASDAGSAFGERPDLLVCDELTHWKKRDTWTAMYSAIAKRKRCVMMVISNAGIMSSWQWPLYKKLRVDPAWHFKSRPGVVASWLTKEDIEEQKRVLLPAEYTRLYGNRWTSGRGDAIPEEQIMGAVDSKLSPLLAPERGWAYAVGLDLGISKDTAALALTARHVKSGRYKLCRLKTWTPTKDKSVQIADVEREIVAWHREFKFTKAWSDPWQGVYLCQRLKAKKIPMELFYFHASGHMDDLTRNTRSQFLDGNVSLYNQSELIEELQSTNIIENNTGKVRLEFPRSELSHGDSACAFVLSLIGARDAKTSATVGRPLGIPYKRDSVKQGRRERVSRLLREAS